MVKSIFFTIITVPVFGVLYLITFCAVLFVLLFSYLNMKKIVHLIIRVWANSMFWITGKKLYVSGAEFVGEEKKYILVTNHGSLFDIPAIMSFFPGVSWFGRERLLKIPLFGHVLKMIDYIPMRTTDIKNTRNMMSRLIDKSDGFTVAIFPEGTRTLDGKLGRFRKGFIHLLRAGTLDVLPVTLNGFYAFKPKNRFCINFDCKLKAHIHKPIRNEELIKLNDNEILAHVRNVIESAYNI